MPAYTSLESFEDASPFGGRGGREPSAFSPVEEDLQFNGRTRSFISVSLPDASKDSAMISLMNTVKPLALPMLSSWAQQREGIHIDLSDHQSTTHRTDYELEYQRGSIIPIAVTWDGHSAYRLNELKNIIQDVPSVKLNCISCESLTEK
ncbi:hypothetical protein [Mucilaginibacter aquaedulcis]|uniref:hypothetical protein n=1 Tax=Mucilaginibacter aquaedulcis TaxID=1187081 RepID=UPI0025B2CAC2|nr:hypothetical protein [Mucilaginibacter aquaedulcis]MDN3548833.1 hypothetical protein [Mucilaginibacter aquaedulcis]